MTNERFLSPMLEAAEIRTQSLSRQIAFAQTPIEDVPMWL